MHRHGQATLHTAFFSHDTVPPPSARRLARHWYRLDFDVTFQLVLYFHTRGFEALLFLVCRGDFIDEA